MSPHLKKVIPSIITLLIMMVCLNIAFEVGKKAGKRSVNFRINTSDEYEQKMLGFLQECERKSQQDTDSISQADKFNQCNCLRHYYLENFSNNEGISHWLYQENRVRYPKTHWQHFWNMRSIALEKGVCPID